MNIKYKNNSNYGLDSILFIIECYKHPKGNWSRKIPAEIDSDGTCL